MQEDFHYYATYCAALIAGFTHEESLDIGYSAQFTDHCSRTLLKKIKAPLLAATTQLQGEMMDASSSVVGMQDITRIWASFHFLPADLYSKPEGGRFSKLYLNKYRLICGPNGDLVKETVELAKKESLQAYGIAMHVLADTWAHRYFAGTPSLVINNINNRVFEIYEDEGEIKKRKINFNHNPASPDNPDKAVYTNTIFQYSENAIMNLGHGRIGHLPDYSYIKYSYIPMWNNYEKITKDNVSDYYYAFCQMVYALRYLKGDIDSFLLDQYDFEIVEKYEGEIKNILSKRQLIACEDWRVFGEKLSGHEIEEFDLKKYQEEYVREDKHTKDNTFIGKYIHAALAHKSMVTNRIFKSGNLMAGFSVDFDGRKFKGIKDFQLLLGDINLNTRNK